MKLNHLNCFIKFFESYCNFVSQCGLYNLFTGLLNVIVVRSKGHDDPGKCLTIEK